MCPGPTFSRSHVCDWPGCMAAMWAPPASHAPEPQSVCDGASKGGSNEKRLDRNEAEGLG